MGNQFSPCGRADFIGPCLPELPKENGHSLALVMSRGRVLSGYLVRSGTRCPEFLDSCQVAEVMSWHSSAAWYCPISSLSRLSWINWLNRVAHHSVSNGGFTCVDDGFRDIVARLQHAFSTLVQISIADPVVHFADHGHITRRWVSKV